MDLNRAGKAKRSYASMEAQEDTLTAELDKSRAGTASDSGGGSSQKRIRHE